MPAGRASISYIDMCVLGRELFSFQRMGQLFNLLRDTDVLAWDFFLGRLDLLSMEAHVGLENAADLGAFPTGES